MYGRWVIAMLAALTCLSCTPVHHAARSSAVTLVAVPDRQLLRQLALSVPDDAQLAPAVSLQLPGNGAPPFVAAAVSLDDERRATDCLSAAVYYEARSEPIDGQRAVAQVVLNRVRDRAFPASVCRVVYQRSAGVCQFSFACDGSTAHPLEPRAWAVAEAIAKAALAGSVYAPVGSATHYHTTAIFPWWAPSLARVGVIGSHVFYRWGNRLAGALSFRQAYSGHEAGQITIADGAIGTTDPLSSASSESFGVTIHRGGTSIGVAGARIEPAVAFGVRVHRGDTPTDAATAQQLEDATPPVQ